MSCLIIDGAEKMNIDEVTALLKQTYWADKCTQEQIKKSMENSRCYGVKIEGEEKLVGFARVISDFATTYYLCDVVIDKKYQNCGLGKTLVSHIVESKEYYGLRGVLITRDAHSLYKKIWLSDD